MEDYLERLLCGKGSQIGVQPLDNFTFLKFPFNFPLIYTLRGMNAPTAINLLFFHVFLFFTAILWGKTCSKNSL